MIISEDEALTRLSNPNNLLNILKNQPKVEIVPVPKGGRTEGAKAVPPMVRELLGTLANESTETQEEIATVFGVTQPVVSSASRGLVDDRLDENLAKATDKTKEKKREDAHNLALDALLGSLNHVNKNIGAVDNVHKAASIATQMSKIISNLEDKDKPANETNVKVVLFQPTLKQENHYEAMEA